LRRNLEKLFRGSEILGKEVLKAGATLIRERYLGKPVGTANVALVELHLKEGVAFCAGATSRGGRKSQL
jgi:hypothetical protein